MQKGFSLVELSIVLVILGLLVGGILTGQNLIRAAELRSIVTEYNHYVTAVHTFRTKYLALPGDMTNATKFWDAEPAANCPGDETTPSTTTATCDGNGDGLISWHGAAGNGGESHRFWQHLANAGMINGTYTGTHSAGSCNTIGSCNVTLGVNAPASKLGSAGWSVNNIGNVPSGHIYFFEGSYGNVFFFGTVDNYTSGRALAPEEAWNVDMKADDGKPGTGNVLPWNNTHDPDCASSDDPSGAEYQLSITGKACPMVFKTKF